MNHIIEAISLPLFMFAMCVLGVLSSIRTEKGRNKSGRFRP
ncbi:hypothetical protein [Mycobacterium sp. SMC-13]